jgi:hypothetical protein
MAREGDLMRRELKTVVVPALRGLGFTGKGLFFQRPREEILDLLDFQHWKYGGEFILEFARRPRGDLQTPWGERIPEAKITVAHVPPLERARLEQRGPLTGEHLRGFAFAGFGEDSGKYESLAVQVASLLPQVDEWLRSGTVGTHVHTLGAA